MKDQNYGFKICFATVRSQTTRLKYFVRHKGPELWVKNFFVSTVRIKIMRLKYFSRHKGRKYDI